LPVLMAIFAGTWALACFLLIEPFFSGGASAFGARYAWLFHNPLALPAWLASADVRAYLGLELLSGGLLALLAPMSLLAALPLLAVNALSSFDWMRSGGGHYSALLVPLLLWAAAHGLRRLKARWQGRGVVPGLSAAVASAVLAQGLVGVSPLRPGFAWPAADPRAARALAAIGN